MKIEFKASGNFLKAENIGKEKIATILNEGELRETDFGTGKMKQVIELAVEIDKQQYVWTTNKTALKKIVELLGDETKSWVGKQLRLGVKEVSVRGQNKLSIVVLEAVTGKVIEGKPVENVKI